MNKVTFQNKYNDSGTGLFKTNTTKDIGSVDLRAEISDIVANIPFTDDDSYTWASPLVAVSGTSTLTGTPSPVITSYASGQTFKIKLASTLTGAATLNFSSIGAKKLYVNPTTQAGSGSGIENQIYIVVYDSTLDSAAGGFLIMSHVIPSPDILVVDTSPGTFNFNFEFRANRTFKCTPSFTGFKTINLSNFANALSFKFIFELSGGAGISFTSIGSGIRMDDVRWELSPDIWIEPGDGKFLGEATYDGTDWFIKISGGPYVKT